MERILRGEFAMPTDPDQAKLRLALLYYWSKAARTARAAVRVADSGEIAEGLILLRSLYNLVVDCLWMCLDPIARARLFYDSTAIALEKQRGMLADFGHEDFSPEVIAGIREQPETLRGGSSSVYEQSR
jgi:hypothetical protein